ncbi:ATP-grasp domain-containing protein [Globicatella sp. PHS-GS-PNBC-21-1553]|uniref:ATP-grasp domain-containing protein n=1 Tax=Globicatella sp. PHS-GS-PNBC-21-1553 TaxID=2885764 RepID=UPI00298F0E1E|nr:ATP-grasp domain-containing protein [Globicatella sp. PHS-GS-PNBC-21-1553]WPC09066.1 ATP-grasp domain-containing protein [Globicatella sp. PHS-GS-PNBC-21-1553]
MQNVLILSAGRRVELIKLLKSTIKKHKINSKVFAADARLDAPALYFADDFFQLPFIKDKEYIPEIISLCNRLDVKLIIPTIDTELEILSENIRKIESETKAKLLVSDISIIKICNDKIKTQDFLERHGFLIPKMYSKEELSYAEFPLFIKPKNGSSSKNIFKINNLEELDTYLNIVPDPIVQEFIEGDEYTVDVFLDFSGNIITIVPRLRLATRSGEISKGRIVKDVEIIDEVKRLMNCLKPIGHITVQLMKTKKGIEFIEINPRFGGGAPMSIEAGANSFENLFRLLNGEKLEYNEDYTDKLLFMRFDSSIALNQKMELVSFD